MHVLLFQGLTHSRAGRSIFSSPAPRASYRITQEESAELVELRGEVESGALVHYPDKDGYTALHRAAEKGWFYVAEFLINNGGDVDAKGYKDSTPLMVAACYGHPDLVALLLHEGADPNTSNPDGNTALSLASLEGHGEIMKALLKRGVKISKRDLVTAKVMAESMLGNTSEVEALLKAGADPNGRLVPGSATALAWACQNGHEEIVKALLAAGAQVDASNESGATGLMAAALQGHVGIVRMLLRAGAGVQKTSETKAGSTVLLMDTKARVQAKLLLLETAKKNPFVLLNPDVRDALKEKTDTKALEEIVRMLEEADAKNQGGTKQ